MLRTFLSVHHLASEISQGLAQQMRRNFAEFSSETKVRSLWSSLSFLLHSTVVAVLSDSTPENLDNIWQI